MNSKYLVIIQCEIAHRRCSGFACTDSFYNRVGKFSGYDENTKYISFTCGGCCGKGLSAKLEHFGSKIAKIDGLTKDDIIIHLSSCMTSDNHHYDRCPTIDYIKNIINKKGFSNIVEGSYISKNAEIKRKNGIYKNY